MSLRRKLLWGAVAVAGLLALVSASDPKGFRRYQRLRAEVESLEERNRRVLEEKRALAREIEALRADRCALERAVREELGFVKPGEVVVSLESP
ncbi:MAG: septum formation initiator family protein [Myxococcales bacterium]|nr:septum formation initiator family protein [Myxococcales bacterium]